jgi:hypothetical protein
MTMLKFYFYDSVNKCNSSRSLYTEVFPNLFFMEEPLK